MEDEDLEHELTIDLADWWPPPHPSREADRKKTAEAVAGQIAAEAAEQFAKGLADAAGGPQEQD